MENKRKKYEFIINRIDGFSGIVHESDYLKEGLYELIVKLSVGFTACDKFLHLNDIDKIYWIIHE